MSPTTAATMTNRERFLALMEYKPVDRVPNWEVGVWPQTVERWGAEGLDLSQCQWDWFTGDSRLGMDYREYIDVNFGMIPPFEYKVLESDGVHEIIQDQGGIIRKALISGTVGGGRMCMDQYLRFPVENIEDFRELKKRYVAALEARYLPGWQERVPGWRARDHVLILGRNCTTLGFYWRAREWMGTENLSFAWFMQPELIHEMMEFIVDFTIEVSRPVLDAIGPQAAPDYVFINEDLSMKTGPLLGPEQYRTYIFPHMKRLVAFYKSKGVRYVVVDSDGNPEVLIPQFMEAGVDALWPLERASNVDPLAWRRKFGRDLRLWGGVDKRELAKGPAAIDAHLRSLLPMIEDGGFIPTVDHTVPPDVSLANFQYYWEQKEKLLRGEL